ncbi:hypothetical protein [Paenibacillus sp. sgz302251]|uniref:hypothetical protein n=1 Tax=Paenibacillus sp. sgz302251 TaxID=3414493 RepID=UPI003C7AC729
MRIDDFMEFGDYINVIVEPNHSQSVLRQYEAMYPQFNSRTIYWYYSVQDFGSILKNVIPDIEDWIYHIEKVIQYGGNLDEQIVSFDDEGVFFSTNEGQDNNHEEKEREKSLSFVFN